MDQYEENDIYLGLQASGLPKVLSRCNLKVDLFSTESRKENLKFSLWYHLRARSSRMNFREIIEACAKGCSRYLRWKCRSRSEPNANWNQRGFDGPPYNEKQGDQ